MKIQHTLSVVVLFIATFAIAAGSGQQMLQEDHPDLIHGWVHEVDDQGNISSAHCPHAMYPEDSMFELVAGGSDTHDWYLTRYEDGEAVSEDDQPNTRDWNNLEAAKTYVDALVLLEVSFVLERQQNANDIASRLQQAP